MRRLAAVLVCLASLCAWADDSPKYGSIAWSPSSAIWGSSWNYPCESEAEDAAIGACGLADCQSVAWVRGQCLAFAVTSDGRRWGWGASTDRYIARARALRQCETQGGGCYIETDLCSPGQ